jgi:hypothetical protein
MSQKAGIKKINNFTDDEKRKLYSIFVKLNLDKKELECTSLKNIKEGDKQKK